MLGMTSASALLLKRATRLSNGRASACYLCSRHSCRRMHPEPGHGRQGMQRLIVLSYVLAGTNVSSADRSVNFLDSNALMRAPTMCSAKLGRRSANREVPWTLEAPIAATCQAAFSLTHSQFRSTDCPSLQDPQPTSSISEHSERIYQSIHQSTNSHGQSRSGKATPSCDPIAALATP